MESTLPLRPDASQPAPGSDDVPAQENVERNTEPTDLMPQSAPSHTSSRSPTPNGASFQLSQDSRGRTTHNSEGPSTSTDGPDLHTSNLNPAAQAAPAGNTNNHQLDVRDALTYLDAIKAQFANSPEVYNMFLDAMKEFKTQQLDTLGVIHRVARLFCGYPFLIEGFNTFLPVGYHIQCVTTLQTNTITVTTPTGIRTTHTEVIEQHQPPLVPMPHLLPLPPTVQPSLPPTEQDPAQTIGIPPRSPFGNASQGGTVLNGTESSDRNSRPNQPEFPQVIAFLNRIKARYQHEPNVYSTSLQILQTYQQNQGEGGVEAARVSHQVSQLLAETPDLIEEFRQFAFMPELAGDRDTGGDGF